MIPERLRAFRNRLRRFLPWLFVLGKWLTLLSSDRSFLRTSGYFRSVASGRPVRADGSPIPWMNYGIVSFLEERLDKDMVLFEYGSGNSTTFYAGRVGRVIAVEDHPAWFEEVSRSVPANAQVILCAPFDPARYAGTIAEQGRRFDVVIIDGKVRLRCLEVARDWLTDGGVIVLDDVNRDEYRPGIEDMKERGFRTLEFAGLKAGSIRSHATVLMYRPDNVLGV